MVAFEEDYSDSNVGSRLHKKDRIKQNDVKNRRNKKNIECQQIHKNISNR
jgi:hypothetical protein